MCPNLLPCQPVRWMGESIDSLTIYMGLNMCTLQTRLLQLAITTVGPANKTSNNGWNKGIRRKHMGTNWLQNRMQPYPITPPYPNLLNKYIVCHFVVASGVNASKPVPWNVGAIGQCQRVLFDSQSVYCPKNLTNIDSGLPSLQKQSKEWLTWFVIKNLSKSNDCFVKTIGTPLGLLGWWNPCRISEWPHRLFIPYGCYNVCWRMASSSKWSSNVCTFLFHSMCGLLKFLTAVGSSDKMWDFSLVNPPLHPPLSF